MEQHELVIIGGGPAGLAAAATAAKAGVESLLMDEQATPGGQVYRAVGGNISPACCIAWP